MIISGHTGTVHNIMYPIPAAGSKGHKIRQSVTASLSQNPAPTLTQSLTVTLSLTQYHTPYH